MVHTYESHRREETEAHLRGLLAKILLLLENNSQDVCKQGTTSFLEFHRVLGKYNLDTLGSHEAGVKNAIEEVIRAYPNRSASDCRVAEGILQVAALAYHGNLSEVDELQKEVFRVFVLRLFSSLGKPCSNYDTIADYPDDEPDEEGFSRSYLV